MNEQNLIPTSQRSKSEARELGTAGGIASGIARRKKKAMREWAEIIGALPAKVVCPDGSLLDDADLDADTMMQQYRKAHNGDTKAATFIANLKGELKQNIELPGMEINIHTTPKGAALTEQILNED